jgi:hypothetical protein
VKVTKILPVLISALACGAMHMVAAQEQGGGGTVYSRKTVVESSNTTPGTKSSTSETIEQRGVMGIKQSNAFAPKYKERLNTYVEQIQMGTSKGWLTQEQASHFSSEVERLRKVEETAAAQNYPKPLVDDIDKQLTQLNIDFTKATNTPAKPAVTTTPAAASPAATSAGTTSNTTAKAAAKVTATKVTKPVVKTSAKKTAVKTVKTVKTKSAR